LNGSEGFLFRVTGADERGTDMAEQSGTGNPVPGEAPSLVPATTTTVSDASLDKFARVIASRMDQKFAVMIPLAQRMQIDADVMTRRMQKVTRPMNFMSDMFPMGD
jgi:hypothetical protein